MDSLRQGVQKAVLPLSMHGGPRYGCKINVSVLEHIAICSFIYEATDTRRAWCLLLLSLLLLLCGPRITAAGSWRPGDRPNMHYASDPHPGTAPLTSWV
jgi:hypothetical protein